MHSPRFVWQGDASDDARLIPDVRELVAGVVDWNEPRRPEQTQRCSGSVFVLPRRTAPKRDQLAPVLRDLVGAATRAAAKQASSIPRKNRSPANIAR